MFGAPRRASAANAWARLVTLSACAAENAGASIEVAVVPPCAAIAIGNPLPMSKETCSLWKTADSHGSISLRRSAESSSSAPSSCGRPLTRRKFSGKRHAGILPRSFLESTGSVDSNSYADLSA